MLPRFYLDIHLARLVLPHEILLFDLLLTLAKSVPLEVKQRQGVTIVMKIRQVIYIIDE